MYFMYTHVFNLIHRGSGVDKQLAINSGLSVCRMHLCVCTVLSKQTNYISENVSIFL